MTRTLRVLLSAVPAAVLLFAAEPLYKAPVGYAPEQPVPYSHKTHLAAGLQCKSCHTMAGDGFAMGIPKESFCMGCHATIKKDSTHIAKLAAQAKSGTPMPWARVYRTMDIVWFSHAVHVTDAKLGCDTCHGKLAQMDVVTKARILNMKDCMDCHAAASAPNGCDTCHPSQ
jgi:c(7)-type cytochrome triheme protein